MTSHQEKADHVALDATEVRQMSVSHPHLDELTRDAANATHAEQSMSLWKGLKTYPYAVGWSVFLSTAIVMEGFDKVLINNLYAYAPFNKNFGVQLADGTYQVTAAWQSALSNASLIGEILGLFLNGIAAEKFGYRKTMIASLIAVIGFIFIVFFAENTTTLVVGQILCGIPWGVFQTITTTYAAEVCPVALRAYLTTYINLCWVMGQLIASSVLRGMLTRSDKWGYKIPFALQWIWPIPIIVGICFAPESPWWLIRKERRDEAKKVLLRLTNADKDPDFNADETIAMMEMTNELEKAHSAGTSYKDCFKRSDLRRTEVVCFTWAIQTLCGSTFMGFSTYFYQQAGMSDEHSFTMSMAQYGLGAIGTMFSWCLMGWFGRRTLYFGGQVTMCVLLAIIGCLGLISRGNSSAQWAIGSMLLLYTFTYDATVGPVCYSLVSELSSNRLRAKTVVLARVLYNLTGLVTNILTPRMLNPSAWNWGAKTGFFWAGSCLLCAVWTFWRLPEPKGRTYGELDILFEKKVAARKFKSTIVDQFAAAGRSPSTSSVEKEALKVQVEKVEHA
ncbi:Sugar/inositol transporter [Neofusicoccum parvum]|uniref:Putative mrt a raffinose family of oligosaccharides transporter protein n=1 Tax=Botryosphaeria parva (strain UCR-NP2) TaxID=1287680 RepID=R1G2N5_BOTPV|nr:putative mrt a raffinose family of oligosaccharides transporter protein [Neofusicoccum parvum UCRNP2]GME64879.1 Sugar/inositol transporter [Neofusicoccum parvum]